MANELTLHESQQLAVQVDVANKYPRQLSTFVNSVFDVVKRDPDFAMTCIYCVPVGKTDGIQKFELGPSVRLSEEMQKLWKHLRIAVNCEVLNSQITCTGLIMDCESNNAETLTEIVNCAGWQDRRIALKVKAMQSCMKRDLRLSIMGKSYANELLNKIIDELLPDQVEAWKYCVSEYASVGVTEATLLNYFKVSKAEDLTKNDVYKAIGVYNFLKEQGQTVEYVFGSGSSGSKKPQVRPEDVTEIKPEEVEQNKNSAQKKTQQAVNKMAGKPKSLDKPPETAPAVEDSGAFESTVFGLLLGTSITEKDFDGILEAEFSITGGVKNVPADMQGQIIAYLESKQEQAGA